MKISNLDKSIFKGLESVFCVNLEENRTYRVVVSSLSGFAGGASFASTTFAVGMPMLNVILASLIFGILCSLATYGFLVSLEELLAYLQKAEFKRRSNNILEDILI